MTKIIGIGGCSRSGKSGLARRIKELLPEKQVLLLDTDDFVFPEADIPMVRDRTDWESPESVDFEKLIRSINVQQNDYDIIVVEGILVFANSELLKLFDTTVQIKISKETFLKRRKKETRWGEEPDWFIEHVWDSYLRYGQFFAADFVFSGENPVSLLDLETILK